MRRATFASLLIFALLCACASTAREPRAGSARLPATSFTAFDGRTVDLARELAADRTVVLVFWQTWCASCLGEAPRLREAARAHADELVFVGVVSGPDSAVDEAELKRVVTRLDLPYPELRDRDGAWSKAFGVTATPTLVALRPDGSEGWRAQHAPADWLAVHRALRATP
jgi:thiol-disulfide isomerase/thioredoxin